MSKIAIIAATYPEIRPLVRHWKRQVRDHAGRRLIFFESYRGVAVCSGIGPEQGRRACEAIIALYRPIEVVSVGIAGALNHTLHIGDVFIPRIVIDSRDSSRIDTHRGEGCLVSFSAVADREQKAKLANAYAAVAVDMEAASVAQGAVNHGLPFSAVKAISDEADFEMPPVERFITHDGRFRTSAFLVFLVWRPWLWPNVLRLALNTSTAATKLRTAVESQFFPRTEFSTKLHVSPRGNG